MESSVVFVIDVSGSMCVTTEVNAKAKIKGSGAREDTIRDMMKEHREFAGYDQYMPGQRRDTTYVSRLQCIQASIEGQIRNIAKTTPNKKVGLITFSNEVTLLGDCTKAPITVAGDKLHDFHGLMEIGEKYELMNPVHESAENIIKALWDLKEEGATALGPAMILGISMAGQRPRSQVILCTDGLANVGIGSLEGVESNFQAFYTEAGEKAWLKGVTVDVVSIIGSECRIENLSVTTEVANGTVERVDPAQLMDPKNDSNVMHALLGRRVIATNCFSMVLMHRGLMFKGEADDEEDRNWLVRDLGNVTDDTTSSFSYTFRPKDEVDLSALKEVPFQVQMLYTRPNGMQCLRVTSATLAVTDNRAEAEAQANISVISGHAQARAAKYAKAGCYEEAQLENRAALRFMKRKGVKEDKMNEWSQQANDMDRVLINEKKKTSNTNDRRNRGDAAAYAISKAKSAKPNMKF